MAGGVACGGEIEAKGRRRSQKAGYDRSLVRSGISSKNYVAVTTEMVAEVRTRRSLVEGVTSPPAF